jgi:ferrous iron transport protein B
LRAALQSLVPQLEAAYPGLPNARWVALRLLGGDERVAEGLRSGTLAGLYTTSSSPSAPAA